MPLKRFVNVIEVVALAAAIVFAVLLFANEPGESAGAPSPGAKIFSANCASCHGADGGGGIGPQLAGRVTKLYPDIDDEIAVVTDGKATMPSFDGDLTPAQIRTVVEYTRTELGK